MNRVFADAAYLIARIRPNDQWRRAASAARSAIGDAKIITTDEVLGEFLTALSSGGPELRRRASNAVREILDSDEVKVIPQSRESFLQGLDRYEARPDMSYSMQDCISMNVMNSEGISEILSSDHHFEQEGFTILMKQDR